MKLLLNKLFLIRVFLLLCLTVPALSCKDDFLDVRPNKALLVPSTYDDFQALLDNMTNMNESPYLQLIASDDLSATDASVLAASSSDRNSYVWNRDIYEGLGTNDWTKPFLQIFYANIVLDGLLAMKAEQDITRFNTLKGAALFFRAYAYFNLAQSFTAPYQATSLSAPGLPLYATADVNLRPGRGTLKQTWAFIISDLQEAAALLPEKSFYKTRPTRTAAEGMLARAFLVMGDFAQAESYAGRAIAAGGKLLDYNDYPSTASSTVKPFPAVLPSGNDEVVFYTQMPASAFLNISTTTTVAAALFSLYHANDLRKVNFFVDRGSGVVNFKGSYSGASSLAHFSGIANDELYLIKAECLARRGQATAALAELNYLLIRRWKKGTFVPLAAPDTQSALLLILAERRKELVFRGLRWSDLRRLNLEPALRTDLQRIVAGKTYMLPANDARYVFPIPGNELLSGIEQNER